MYSIVIADDEAKICHGLQSLIAAYLPECSVDGTFQDGAGLMEYLQSNQPDILILDIEMPGESGLEIARYVRGRSLPCYIIMITAHYNFEYAKAGIKCQVNEFITKPYSTDELIHAVQLGIQYINSMQKTKREKLTNLRSLVQGILHTYPLQQRLCNDIFLCGGSAKILQLCCTEISFPDTNLSDLNSEDLRALKLQFRSSAEGDCTAQTSLGFVSDSGNVSILVFHKEAPDLSFISPCEAILMQHADIPPSHCVKTFPSFSAYFLQKQFDWQMEQVIATHTPQGTRLAKIHLSSFLSSLDDEQRALFSEYLASCHQIAMDFSDLSALSDNINRLFAHFSASDSNNDLLSSILRYIHQNYASADFSRETVAEYAGISVSHFTRLFSKHTNQTFSSYLIRLRMEKAAELLLTTDLSTVQIAADTGFYNPEYFRTSFARYYGMTPRKFRLSQQKVQKGS